MARKKPANSVMVRALEIFDQQITDTFKEIDNAFGNQPVPEPPPLPKPKTEPVRLPFGGMM